MNPLRRLGRIGKGHRMVPFGRIAILVQTAAALAFVAFLLVNQGFRPPWDAEEYPVEAVFSDAAGLKAENEPPVTVSGVLAGKVSEVRYERGRAVVTLQLEDRDAREVLRSDAHAELLPRSALNDYVVDVDPGSAGTPLRDGRRISERRTVSPVQFDRLTGVLDADTRAWTQVLLGELQVALDGRSGRLADALRRLGRLTEPTGEVAAALAERRRLLAGLVGELDLVFGALGDRGAELAAAIRGGRRTLEATSGRERELAATMRRLPGTLAALEGALDQVERLSVPLNPALRDLRPAARSLPTGLRALRDFVPLGRGLVRDLDPLVREGVAPTRELRRALRALGPTAGALQPSLPNVLSVVRAIDDNKQGIAPLGENFSGVFSTQDANGPMIRGLGFFEAFRCENFGFGGDLFPLCLPPSGRASQRVAGTGGATARAVLRRAGAPLLALRALLEVCTGGPRVARNAAACLPIVYTPDLVRALPRLGDEETARLRASLARSLPERTLADLRTQLGAFLAPASLGRVLPGVAAPRPARYAPLSPLDHLGASG